MNYDNLEYKEVHIKSWWTEEGSEIDTMDYDNLEYKEVHIKYWWTE